MSWKLRPLEGSKSAAFILGKRIEPDAQGHVTVSNDDARVLLAAGWTAVSTWVDEPTAGDIIKLARPMTLQKLFRGK